MTFKSSFTQFKKKKSKKHLEDIKVNMNPIDFKVGYKVVIVLKTHKDKCIADENMAVVVNSTGQC